MILSDFIYELQRIEQAYPDAEVKMVVDAPSTIESTDFVGEAKEVDEIIFKLQEKKIVYFNSVDYYGSMLSGFSE